MKVVITPAVREEAKYLCDFCKQECFGELTFTAWYGSRYDLTKHTCHLCDDCWEGLRDHMERHNDLKPVFQTEDVMI